MMVISAYRSYRLVNKSPGEIHQAANHPPANLGFASLTTMSERISRCNEISRDLKTTWHVHVHVSNCHDFWRNLAISRQRDCPSNNGVASIMHASKYRKISRNPMAARYASIMASRRADSSVPLLPVVVFMIPSHNHGPAQSADLNIECLPTGSALATPAASLDRDYDISSMNIAVYRWISARLLYLQCVILQSWTKPLTLDPWKWRRHDDMETLSPLQALCEGNPPVIGAFSRKGSVMLRLMFFLLLTWTCGWTNSPVFGGFFTPWHSYGTVMRYGRSGLELDILSYFFALFGVLRWVALLVCVCVLSWLGVL